jgi:hypothetical protein
MPRKEVIQTSVVWYAHPDEMHEQTAYHDNSLSENLAKSTFSKASPTPSGMQRHVKRPWVAARFSMSLRLELTHQG